MKVAGGVIGLTQNINALNRFCLTAPVINSVLQQYYENYDIVNSQQLMQHCQLIGSHLLRIRKNTTKLVGVMENFDLSFIEDSSVFNVVSKAVLPEIVADEVLYHQKIGDSMYKEFINGRFKWEISVWSPLKKRNLKTFTSQGKTLKSKVEGKVIQLKEEKSL